MDVTCDSCSSKRLEPGLAATLVSLLQRWSHLRPWLAGLHAVLLLSLLARVTRPKTKQKIAQPYRPPSTARSGKVASSTLDASGLLDKVGTSHIIAVRTAKGSVIAPPLPDTVVYAGDVIVVQGAPLRCTPC